MRRHSVPPLARFKGDGRTMTGETKTMKTVRIHRAMIVYILILFGLWPTAASAETPTAQIKSTVDQVIRILADPGLRQEAKRIERRKLLRETIVPSFDFKEIAKRSLGSHWRRLRVDEQNEFVVLFRDLLEKVYLDRIESYDKERFIYVTETIDEPYAEVGSKILTAKGEEFSIRYRMLQTNGQWKVYDVVVEDISLVNNYRSQFNRIISQSSYNELVRKMKEKLAGSPAK
jgi:phospholipid transport system substrate-binding protein